MIIRRAVLSDMKDVIGLFNQLDSYHRVNLPDVYHEPPYGYRENFFKETISSSEQVFAVAVDNDKVIGFAQSIIGVIENDPLSISKKYMKIDNLVVDEVHRRKGIARDLLNYMEDEALNRGLDYIDIGVCEFNQAKRVYESAGYSTLIRKMRKNLK